MGCRLRARSDDTTVGSTLAKTTCFPWASITNPKIDHRMQRHQYVFLGLVLFYRDCVIMFRSRLQNIITTITMILYTLWQQDSLPMSNFASTYKTNNNTSIHTQLVSIATCTTSCGLQAFISVRFVSGTQKLSTHMQARMHACTHTSHSKIYP